MTDKEQLLERYLLRIAENLDISQTMREKAEKRKRFSSNYTNHKG